MVDFREPLYATPCGQINIVNFNLSAYLFVYFDLVIVYKLCSHFTSIHKSFDIHLGPFSIH
jgi:hypothetical protein